MMGQAQAGKIMWYAQIRRFKAKLYFTGKVKDFNGSIGSQSLDEGALSLLEQLMTSTSPNAQQIDALWKALQWPAGMSKPDFFFFFFFFL